MQELHPFFKSIIDRDNAAIVVCDKRHDIIYMNPAAIANYSKRGGEKLVGQSVLSCHNEHSRERIKQVVQWFSASADNNKVHTYYSEKHNRDVYMIALRDGDGNLIGYYEKHEYRAKDPAPFYDMTNNGQSQQ